MIYYHKLLTMMVQIRVILSMQANFNYPWNEMQATVCMN